MNFYGSSDPAFACTEVEFVASIIKAIYSVAARTDEIKLGVQLACVGLRVSLATGVFS